MEINLSENQRKIVESKKKFVVAACGRRFGKKFVCAYMALEQARKPNSRIFWVVPSNDMIVKTVWEQFLSLVPKDEVERSHKKDRHGYVWRIDFKNGSRLNFAGAYNPDHLRGNSVDLLILDECAYMKERAWTVAKPSIADRNGRVLFISTPQGTNNWFCDIFKYAESSVTDHDTFQFTTLDGGFVREDVIERAKRDVPEKLFAQEFLAEFVDLREAA